jgi:hypothetical protein
MVVSLLAQLFQSELGELTLGLDAVEIDVIDRPMVASVAIHQSERRAYDAIGRYPIARGDPFGEKRFSGTEISL